MSSLLDAIAYKKDRLDGLRPLPPEALSELEHFYDVELTYINGSTLSPVETALVIEKGATIGGKPLADQMEALDHYDAIKYVRKLGRETTPLTESSVRNLHRLVVQRSHPGVAGRYAGQDSYVRTDAGRHVYPPPAEIPELMRNFGQWLGGASATPEAAFAAHLRLSDIHPFNDGNGRIARLLMNAILIRGGYPPIAVRPEDRHAYIRALHQWQDGGGSQSLDSLLYERLDATLDDYLSALQA